MSRTNLNWDTLPCFSVGSCPKPPTCLTLGPCRPVDCYTKQPLIFLPGYINETVYSDRVESGWSWNAYSTINKQLEVGLGDLP